MSVAEMRQRGWDGVDVVFVSGDAYVDHPSFAAALLGRILEAAGWRVAILDRDEARGAANAAELDTGDIAYLDGIQKRGNRG